MLDSEQVRKVLQTAIFAADVVILPARIRIAEHEPAEVRAYALRQLHRLRDLDALEFWEIEGIDLVPPPVNGVPTVRISAAEYGTLYAEALDLLMRERRTFLGPQATSFDGVTEIVLGKQALIHAGLTKTLNASSVLHDHDSARGYGRFLANLLDPTGLVESIGEALALELDLPEVSVLPDAVLERGRARLHPFRHLVIARLRARGPVLLGPESLDSLKDTVVREIVTEYLRFVAQGRATGGIARSLAEHVWRIGRISDRRVLARASEPVRDHPLQLLVELKRTRPPGSPRGRAA